MSVRKIKELYHTYKKNPLAQFLLKGFLFFILWDLIIYDYLIVPSVHNWVIFRLVNVSVRILGWIYPAVSGAGTEIFIHGRHFVHIGIPCNGIDVMGVFACIVLAYQAKWIPKLWMIVAGCLLIFLLNTLRITILTVLLYRHHFKSFDFNHKYIFNIILYGILLFVFSLWSSKFGIKTNKETGV